MMRQYDRAPGELRPTQITWSKRNSQLLFFRDRQGRMHIGRIGTVGTSSASTSSSSKEGGLTATMPFKAKMTVNDPELYLEMFDQGWRYLAAEDAPPWKARRGRGSTRVTFGS